MSASRQTDSDPMDLDRDTPTVADPGSANQATSSSPLSTLPSVTPSPPSSGIPAPNKKKDKSPATASVCNTRKQTALEQAEGNADKAFRPSESEYRDFEFDLLDPKNLDIASTAMHKFLSALEKAVFLPTRKYYTPRQNLQAFLIQQQLLAGVPVDKLEPMQGVGSRQRVTAPEGVLQRFNTPAYMTVTPKGTFLPRIPPAKFTGTLNPLPVQGGLPKPAWTERATANFCRQNNESGTNSTNSSTTNGTQPPNTLLQEKDTMNKLADDKMDFSAYFSSTKEQELITQFYAEHFSTGSGILVDQSAKADDTESDATESDYPTDYWSDPRDETESENES